MLRSVYESLALKYRAVGEEMFPRRKAVGLDAEGLRRLVRSRLRVAEALDPPSVRPFGELGRDGYRIERMALQTAPGVTVPALVFVPFGGPARQPAVLYVHGSGKGTDAAPGGDIEGLVRSGHVVLAPDPRGVGESRPTSGGGGYDPAWQMLQRALLVDRTLVGMQVEDLLGTFGVLESRGDVDPGRVAVLGKGHGGVLALVLAALEPKIEKAAVEGTVLSYMEVVRARYHEGLTAAFVPGVLQDFDLPDLAASLAPRPLWVVDPHTPTGALVPVGRARTELAPAVLAYDRAGRAAALRVLHRPEGWPIEKVYADWRARGAD
jgi:dienelactone hydrolase